MVSHTMEETYNEAQKFVNLEHDLRFGKKEKFVIKMTKEKEKRKHSLSKVTPMREGHFHPLRDHP